MRLQTTLNRAFGMAESQYMAITEKEQYNHHNNIISLDDARHKAEKQAIMMALQENKYNMTQSAKALRISRVTLYRLLRKHKIEGLRTTDKCD